MSDHPVTSLSSAADNHRGLRAVALAAVIIGVLALAAAAFLLSYSGINAIALSAGVSRSLARLYPLIFDAMLVIACAAVLSLRGAGTLARCYAWLSMLALLAAAAAADALHATGAKLPHRPAAATVAIIPWALVLIGFGLLMTMLRHTRERMIAAQDAAARDAAAQQATGHVQPRPGIQQLLSPQKPTDVTATGDTPATSGMAAATDVTATGDVPATRSASTAPDLVTDNCPDLAIDTEPGLDDPTSDEARLADQPGTAWVPCARDEQMASSDVAYGAGCLTAHSTPDPGALRPDPGALSPAPTSSTYTSSDPSPLTPTPSTLSAAPTTLVGTALEQQPADEAAEPEQALEDQQEHAGAARADAEPGQPADDDAATAAPSRPALPQLHRMWSTPTPPRD